MPVGKAPQCGKCGNHPRSKAHVESCGPKKRGRVWGTGQYEVPIAEMDDDHLLNAVRSCTRNMAKLPMVNSWQRRHWQDQRRFLVQELRQRGYSLADALNGRRRGSREGDDEPAASGE